MASGVPPAKDTGFSVAQVSSYRNHDKKDAVPAAATTIPDRFKGTKADQDDMVLLGKKQVLRRNFRFTTILGFASTGECCKLSLYNPTQSDPSFSPCCMGDAACFVRIRSTRRRHRYRLLGIDCWRHWHDIRVYITGRDGFNVSYMYFSQRLDLRSHIFIGFQQQEVCLQPTHCSIMQLTWPKGNIIGSLNWHRRASRKS